MIDCKFALSRSRARVIRDATFMGRRLRAFGCDYARTPVCVCVCVRTHRSCRRRYDQTNGCFGWRMALRITYRVNIRYWRDGCTRQHGRTHTHTHIPQTPQICLLLWQNALSRVCVNAPLAVTIQHRNIATSPIRYADRYYCDNDVRR